MVSSWLEYLRQHERITVFDKKLQVEADAFHIGENPPVINYYLSELG